MLALLILPLAVVIALRWKMWLRHLFGHVFALGVVAFFLVVVGRGCSDANVSAPPVVWGGALALFALVVFGIVAWRRRSDGVGRDDNRRGSVRARALPAAPRRVGVRGGWERAP